METCYHHIFSFVCQLVKARVECKEKAAGTIAKLRKLYEEGWQLSEATFTSDSSEMTCFLMEFEEALETKYLKFQAKQGLLREAVQLRKLSRDLRTKLSFREGESECI